MKDALCNLLKDCVGKENFSDAVIDLISYSYDASDHVHRPEAAVWPTDKAQVSRLLAFANEKKIPVVPRGAGTGLSGMAVPIKGGIVLDMSRMNRILDLRIADRYVVVEPGLVYGDLQKALMPSGFFFPPDPASGLACTLGGNVSTNAGGLKGAKYGVTKDYVLGLEVVLPDGRIMRTGSKCMKSVSGYDLTRLFVGSEGTLGVFTEITLKINPLPRERSAVRAAFEDMESAGVAVSQITHAGLIPSVLEILDERSLELLNRNLDQGLPLVEALLLVETDGHSKADTEYQIKEIIEILEQCNAKEIDCASTPQEIEDLWYARKAIGGILTKIEPNFRVEDVTVPISKVPVILKGIQEIAKIHGVRMVTLGHMGDGNIHPCFTYDGSDPTEAENVEKAAAELFKLAVELGGTLSGEHGIGISKSKFMPLEHDPVALEMMKTLKKTFDPNNILNPGKMALDDKINTTI